MVEEFKLTDWTKEEIGQYIKYFQIRLTNKLKKEWLMNLSIGKCREETIQKLIIVTSLIDIFYDCYKEITCLTDDELCSIKDYLLNTLN